MKTVDEQVESQVYTQVYTQALSSTVMKHIDPYNFTGLRKDEN